MTVTLKQLLLNCGTSEMWWIWQNTSREVGRWVNMCSLSAGISIHWNGCLKGRCTKEPVLNAAITNSKEAVLLRNYCSKHCSPFNLNQLLLKSKTNSTKVDHSQFVSVCSGNLCCWSWFLSLPHQIPSGFKSGAVFYFPFYPSFLYLCPFSYCSLSTCLNWQLQSSSYDSTSKVIYFLSLGDKEGGVTEFFRNDLSHSSQGELHLFA